ncbi:GIY-YIG nuclease family protein [Pseudomonas sp. BF-B-28]|jgi:hypothetical protein|uniref:GIY-YIG nuclease family protein n=1 Tax=Pseudomonas sp. BF-B-28 TaxID=2832353 RepID=UPI001CBEB136|nr:GIY-YIG nuclease family protein [Pseudomonas sp. BF-B-28]
MTPGYIYILQNPLYGAYVVKIGLTKREPDVRARELYVGSSGVPTPFEIATAYSVGDCKLAEKRVHKRFAAFRLNGRREFFRISPAVAASVAYDTCAKLNEELGLPPPKPFEINKSLSISNEKSRNKAFEDADTEIEMMGRLGVVDPRTLRESPIGTSVLTPEQIDRIEILGMQLAQVYPEKRQDMLDGFTRDKTPERELKIWEHITKAYLTIEQVEFASDDLKQEAFTLLLMRSWSRTDEVLSSIKLKHFTHKSAKHLLQAYEMRPKPISVSKFPNSPVR